jgi:hypothetical protein
MDLFRLKFPKQSHDRNLAGIFISMVAGHHQGSWSFAISQNSNGNHQVCPTGKIVGVGNIKVTQLPPGL